MVELMLKTCSDSSVQSLVEARQLIDGLDLSYIVKRLSYNPRITGWTRKEAERCLSMYKNFLFLLKKYPDQRIPPSKPVDEFWHEHILFTRQYHDDCMKIFGMYQHHAPGDKSSKEDEKYFKQLFREVTQKLYFAEYGEYL